MCVLFLINTNIKQQVLSDLPLKKKKSTIYMVGSTILFAQKKKKKRKKKKRAFTLDLLKF